MCMHPEELQRPLQESQHLLVAGFTGVRGSLKQTLPEDDIVTFQDVYED